MGAGGEGGRASSPMSDGLGGRTHMYWCESQCDVTWALIPLPSALAALFPGASLLHTVLFPTRHLSAPKNSEAPFIQRAGRRA